MRISCPNRGTSRKPGSDQPCTLNWGTKVSNSSNWLKLQESSRSRSCCQARPRSRLVRHNSGRDQRCTMLRLLTIRAYKAWWGVDRWTIDCPWSIITSMRRQFLKELSLLKCLKSGIELRLFLRMMWPWGRVMALKALARTSSCPQAIRKRTKTS